MDFVSDAIPGNYKTLNHDSVKNNSPVLRNVGKPKEKLQIQPAEPKNNEKCSEHSLYYFQSFAESASIDGLKFLGESGRNIIERIFWTVTLLLSLVLCILLVIETFEKWTSSPILVSFATSQTSIFEIPFPAITICPEIKADRDIFNYTEIYLKKANNATLTSDEERQFEFMSIICDYSDMEDGNETVAAQEMIDFFLEVSPDFDESVIELVWRGNKSETNRLFSPILTSDGICYTFNMLDRSELFTNAVYFSERFFSADSQSTEWSPEKGYKKSANIDSYPRRTPLAGIKGGLSITFMVTKDQLDYACGDSLQGFKVTLHQPAEFPRIRQNYFRIPLGQSVVVSVKPDVMSTSEDLRSYNPQDRKCYFIKERNLKYFNIYNQQNCLVECLVNFTLATCGCVNFHAPKEQTVPVCGPASQDCVEDAKILFLANEVDLKIKQGLKSTVTRSDLNKDDTDYSDQCNCLPACHSLDFDTEVSQANWDWHETFKVLKETGEWNEVYETLFGGDNIKIARMMIYFKDMQFLTSERRELYGYVDFWANIGGIVGLFTGFSFVTIFELFYYLSFRLVCNIRMFGRRNWSGSTELSE